MEELGRADARRHSLLGPPDFATATEGAGPIGVNARRCVAVDRLRSAAFGSPSAKLKKSRTEANMGVFVLLEFQDDGISCAGEWSIKHGGRVGLAIGSGRQTKSR